MNIRQLSVKVANGSIERTAGSDRPQSSQNMLFLFGNVEI